MTVRSYLYNRATEAVLDEEERASIAKSIATIGTRLNAHFDDAISHHFAFGSYTRGTILPRSLDTESDVDYMVVFKDEGYAPQTYLDRLRRFGETRYFSSEIYQASPTFVLNLNHIRFELVPALVNGSGYSIPDGAGRWMVTTPNAFNRSLTEKNQACKSRLKPAIRLAKMWNASRGYPFKSYPLEREATRFSFHVCDDTVASHFFMIMDNLMLPVGAAQWRLDCLARTSEIIGSARYYLSTDPELAENEIRKLFPL
jgi:hypothetical protein